jgi:ubiquitin-like protein Pup
MPEREHKKRPSKGRDASDAAEVAPAEGTAARAEALKEELDELLDEIDAVLEVNAEEFVRSYVQKGGE